MYFTGRRMRLRNKLRVTFTSFGVLLLVNLTTVSGLALAPPATTLADSKSRQGGTLPGESLTSSPIQNHSSVPTSAASFHPLQSEEHFLHHKEITGATPPTEENYQNDQHHYYSSHVYQHDEHFTGVSASSLIGRENCKLPENWKGEWFQSGVVSPIMIDHKSVGDKGNCIEKSGDKYLFFEKSTNCYRCIVINERHANVLQYKESPYCEDPGKLEHLCSQIPGDAPLNSLFRIDSQPEKCPFEGPHTFTYNKGSGVCKSPLSYVSECTQPSRLLLKYESCPDVHTESKLEELQCLAEWREGSHHYLLGKLRLDHSTTNEEAYRCFIFEKTKNGHTGYNVAISGDATCTGVSSPTEGARALVLTKVDKEQIKCKFPTWLSSHSWHTLDGKMVAKMHHKDSAMHITDDNRKNSSGHYSGLSLTNTGTFSGFHLSFPANNMGSQTAPRLFTGETRIVCQNRKDISDRHVAIVAHHTEGCKSESICMHIYKRGSGGSHVTEVQMIRKSDQGMEDSDCFKPDALGPKLPYVTLINPAAKAHRCPNLGKYLASGVSENGRVLRDTSCGPSGGQGFHSVVVGCGSKATMEFHSKCATQDPITSYECHGSWIGENNTGFLIASPLSRSSTSAHRYCFIYSESEEGLRVFSSSETCRRNFSPGIEGGWAFNLTVDSQCAEAVTGASASFPKSCDLLISVGVLSSVIFMTVSNFLLVSNSLTRSRHRSLYR